MVQGAQVFLTNDARLRVVQPAIEVVLLEELLL